MVFSLSYIGGTRNLNPSRIAVRFYLRGRNIQRDFIESGMPRLRHSDAPNVYSIKFQYDRKMAKIRPNYEQNGGNYFLLKV